MKSILFWDSSCQRPYDTQSIRREATGGTEASVSRIADALDAYVIQHNRVEPSGRYRSPERIAGITHVILNRDSRALPQVREYYPDARYYLWVHDQLDPDSKRGRRLARTASILSEMAVTIVCVSDWQRRGVEATLRHMGVADKVATRTIYNPVDDALVPDASPVDRNKLVFFSAQNRGLLYALDAFSAMRRQLPDLRLVIGNPGYKIGTASVLNGVTDLGPRPQSHIHVEVRTALCTFLPNFVLPETFGLVFAESMALGTPVLTHDCGAAAEVIRDREQVLPATSGQRAYERMMRGIPLRFRSKPANVAARYGLFDVYLERIRSWQSGARPQSGPDPRFRLATVADHWRSLLSSRDS